MSTDTAAKIKTSLEMAGLANVLRECVLTGAILIDGQERIEAVTPQAAQLLGSDPTQLLGQPIKVLPKPLQTVVGEVLSRAQPLVSRQAVWAVPTRGSITFSLNAAARQAGKTASGAVVLVTSLTPGRRCEMHLQRLDRLASLGTLSTSMAHEIRNALVAGKTFIDLLLEKNQDAELAEVVRREIRRIDSIVSQMLKFGGPAHPAVAALHLHEVLDQSLRLIQPRLQVGGLSASRSYEARPDLVSADDSQLQQVFLNLFLNAIEAMEPQGRLTVATDLISAQSKNSGSSRALSPKQVRIKIQDTGTGIAPENLSHLFEPFFTTKPDGTGLGLAIARRILQEHGGGITVESTPGQGTTINVLLPALESLGGQGLRARQSEMV